MFLTSDFDQSLIEQRSQALVLEAIIDQHGHLTFVFSTQTTQAANRDDLGVAIFFLVLHRERHLPVIVEKADALQALMRGSLTELQWLEITQVDSALR